MASETYIAVWMLERPQDERTVSTFNTIAEIVDESSQLDRAPECVLRLVESGTPVDVTVEAIKALAEHYADGFKFSIWSDVLDLADKLDGCWPDWVIQHMTSIIDEERSRPDPNSRERSYPQYFGED